MGRRIVVALGGNAIQPADRRCGFKEQLKNIRDACRQLVELVKRGHELVITHGNGPQVGDLLLQQEEAAGLVQPKPLDVLVAMTQGQIGYMLQQTLTNLLREEGIDRPVVTVVTQVLVDGNDPDFRNPSKPVGPFYTEDEAIVIASGGGGVPVVMDGCEIRGVEAVVDKDLAGEKLAEMVEADTLLILTDIDKVRLNYGKPNEKCIDRMSVEEAKRYMREGHFPPGRREPTYTGRFQSK